MGARRGAGSALGAIAAVGLLAAVALPARADIYQCVAKDGSVRFTTTRPKGMRCTVAVHDSKEAKARRRARRKAAPRARAPMAAMPPAPALAEALALYDRIVVEASHLYQLPAAFLRAVVKVESGFNPQVVSEDGAIGLMQLMPRTAAAMGVQNPFDPRQNIFGGARYLRVLANKFNGDLVLTIAAYNAGEGAVVRYRGVPPYEETRRYVRRVLEHYYAYRQHGR